MALFQPTNVIPSSFTVGVVDAVRDTAYISWQVNGNSAMTAYKIEFFNNNDDSTPIYVAGTGKTSFGIPTGGFFGTDRFGQPKMFTWTARTTWSDYNTAFANGNQYQFKITQYWQEGGEEKSIEQIELNVFVTRDTPQCSIQRSAKDDYSNPTSFPNGSTLPASIGYFVGAYSQAQGAPVRECRWQVAQWVNGVAGEILADTGDVDTPTLQFEFNGFFIGNEYAVRCSGKADYQTYGTQDFDSGWTNFTAQALDGQGQSEYTGNFTVQCLPKENAALLQWEAIEVIAPTLGPDGFNPTTSDSSVTIPADDGEIIYSVTWDKQNDSPMNFPSPWTFVWSGKINWQSITYSGEIPQKVTIISTNQTKFSPDSKVFVEGSNIYSVNGENFVFSSQLKTLGDRTASPRAVAFSPDGALLFAGELSGSAAIYTVSGTNISYLEDIYIQQDIFTAEFSPDGKILAVGGRRTRTADAGGTFVYIYTVEGSNITFVEEIGVFYSKTGFVYDLAFSPDGKTLVVGGIFGRSTVYIFSVDGTNIEYVGEIESIMGSAPVNDLAFSPDGKTLVVGGSFTGGCLIFNVDGTNIEYAGQIIDATVSCLTFSADGKILAVGHTDSNAIVSVFDVDGTNVEPWLEITTDEPFLNAVAFSPDGKTLVVNGYLVYKCEYSTFGDLAKIKLGNGKMLSVFKNRKAFDIKLDTSTIASAAVSPNATAASIVLTPTQLCVYSYESTGSISANEAGIDYQQEPITSVSIYGGKIGVTVKSISVYKGDGSNILLQYATNPDFEPAWSDSQYELYMTANFNGNLEGGTGTASGDGFRIYRQEVGSNILTPIANLKSTETALKDYGIRSRRAYSYQLFAYDINGAFMKNVENDTVISTCFKNYSLLVCDYDSEKDAYHVRKQYLFALNLSEGSVGNNNSPTLNANFTPYPTRTPSTQNYTSGTLQGLIGAIYTVPALIEQIGGFKHTAKPATLDYFDSVDLEKELYELSVAPYQLFLRDMKGHLRMVATNGAISMTQDLKKRQLSTTISFPWVEIGDASDVTIIQTPDDYGWNSDNQVLDARLDVDPTTGVLTATYPKPYDGTKFYLTGADKEILGAKTPLGVTPAQFNLSADAKEPDDGTLTATAKVNVEEE